MPKVISEDEKRVKVNCLVAPITKIAVGRIREMLRLSEGELFDDAVALIVQGYADAPLEDGEAAQRVPAPTAEMIERATRRVPVQINAERPEKSVGTVTVQKVPEHLTSGASVVFRERKPQTWRRGPRQKGDTKR